MSHEPQFGLAKRSLHREWRDLPDPPSLGPNPRSSVSALPSGAVTGIRRALTGRDLYRSSVREILVGAAEYAASRALAAQPPAPRTETEAFVTLMDRGTAVKLTEDGSPWFPEDVVDEFGCAMSWSLRTASAWMRDAVELAWRLPRTWDALVSGALDPFRARHLARLTSGCSLRVAAEVDRLIGPRLGLMSRRAVEQCVLDVSERLDLKPAPADCERSVSILHSPWADGSYVEAHLDAGDARQLERSIARVAAHLAALGDTRELGARRAAALGVLASPRQALEILEMTPDQVRTAAVEAGVERVDPRLLSTHRQQAVLHVYLTDQRPISAEVLGLGDMPLRRIQELVGHRQVTIRPVVDTASLPGRWGYHPSPALAEAVRQRHRTCVFPYCTRASDVCDIDHRTPYSHRDHLPMSDTSDGGQDHPPPTRLDNLQPLCRHHHRLKTHLGWSCRVPDPSQPTVIWWTSPEGLELTTTPDATLEGHRPVTPST